MRRNVRCLVSLLAALAAFPSVLGAQQTPELNEIVVTATRIDSPILASPSAISIITAQDLAAPGTVDLSSVLEGRSGLVVQDYGPLGSAKSVSIRGSTSDQVLVLLDGVRLNSSRISQVDLSTIPIENIDRVEVLQGGASTMYGSGAIGGVVNIITRNPDRPSLTVSLANGSYIPHSANEVSSSMATTPVPANLADLADSQDIRVSASGVLGGVGLEAGGSLTRAANAFTWDDQAVIGAWRRRSNADVLSGSAYTGLTMPAFGGQFAVKGVFAASDTGAPGQIYSPWVSTTGRQADAAATATVSWKTDRFLSDALTFDVKTVYRYDQLSYADPAIAVDSLHRTHTIGADVTQRLTASDTLAFVYGGTAYLDYATSTNYAGPKDRLNLAAFASAPWAAADALTVTPALRYDYFSDTSGSFSYSLAAVWRLSDLSSLRASASSSYRAPTFNDLYWSDPYTVTNPDLKPETSYEAETGWSFQSERVSLDASAFLRFVTNNIVWWTDPVTYITYVKNLTRTLYPGAELRVKVGIIGPLSIEGSYTFLPSYLLDDGTTTYTPTDNLRVVYTPEHTVGVSLRWDGSPVGAALEAQYVSEKFTDNANSAAGRIPGYFVANASAAYAASDQVTVTLAAKNLLNSLYYTQLGYPMPPFSLEAGMQLHL